MNTTNNLKSEIYKAAQNCGHSVFFKIFADNADRFDKTLIKQWQDYYAHLSNGKSMKHLIDSCDCAANTVRSWNSTIPKKREQFVMIGCYFFLDSDEVSKLMTRFGGFSKLRDDNFQDIMYLRILEITKANSSRNTPDEFDNELTYKARIGIYDAEISRIETSGLWSANRIQLSKGTKMIGKYFDPLLYEMIEKSHPQISSSYYDLSKYLVNYRKNIGYKTNKEFCESEKISSSLERIFSCMTTEVNRHTRLKDLSPKPMPRRKQIIALCLHFGMPLKDINTALSKANMEELCPRDRYEAALIFVLQQLYFKDHRFGSKEMRTKANREAQRDLESLYENSYKGLFGYVYSKLSLKEFSDFILAEEGKDINDTMCV